MQKNCYRYVEVESSFSLGTIKEECGRARSPSAGWPYDLGCEPMNFCCCHWLASSEANKASQPSEHTHYEAVWMNPSGCGTQAAAEAQRQHQHGVHATEGAGRSSVERRPGRTHWSSTAAFGQRWVARQRCRWRWKVEDQMDMNDKGLAKAKGKV